MGPLVECALRILASPGAQRDEGDYTEAQPRNSQSGLESLGRVLLLPSCVNGHLVARVPAAALDAGAGECGAVAFAVSELGHGNPGFYFGERVNDLATGVDSAFEGVCHVGNIEVDPASVERWQVAVAVGERTEVTFGPGDDRHVMAVKDAAFELDPQDVLVECHCPIKVTNRDLEPCRHHV